MKERKWNTICLCIIRRFMVCFCNAFYNFNNCDIFYFILLEVN